ncbi:MAG: hypothetical protein QOC81_4693 [Thermoanaerobaculia bacterium]|jgi:hypothetical protein|nr:hypothetical protein [Thermoanaerobaculia bacterium]
MVRASLLLVALIAAGSPATTAQAQTAVNEYQVKAAYILNFARYVEWPADVLPASSPLTIAIIGDDPFGGALDDLQRTKSANGHPILLRHFHWNEVITQSEIVYISSSEDAHLPQILRFLGNQSVLTISDIDRFSLRGGIIEFRMVGNRVRFDIDRKSAIAARLSISSKLLSLARAVHEGTGAP